jgi:hypothetical protein
MSTTDIRPKEFYSFIHKKNKRFNFKIIIKNKNKKFKNNISNLSFILTLNNSKKNLFIIQTRKPIK